MSALSSIGDFKEIHQGKRLFVLASGPSLANHDLTKLKHRLVMGLNRSFLVYPDAYYHCCMDLRLFDLFPELIRKTRYLFTLEGRPWGIPMHLLGADGFSTDLTQGVYSGYTISYVALQVAVYMGFKEIIYLGLDLSHQSGRTHFFGFDFHSRNHVDTEFPRMRKMVEVGVQECVERGISVYTCSEKTNIEGLKYVPFEEAVRW